MPPSRSRPSGWRHAGKVSVTGRKGKHASGTAARSTVDRRPDGLLGHRGSREPSHVPGQQALGAALIFVADRLPVLQRAEPFPVDDAEMDEHVLSLRADDKSEPLFRVEPLDGTGWH